MNGEVTVEEETKQEPVVEIIEEEVEVQEEDFMYPSVNQDDNEKVSDEELQSVIDQFTQSVSPTGTEGTAHEPLKMVFESYSSNGKARLSFNQKTIVPSFID